MNKVIVITGPTAVGKTKLSIELAKRYNGEIINADAVQVYKGLDIGSAKVTEEEKEDIPHHLFDIKEVNEEYTIYHYQKDCRKLIKEVQGRGKTPILVGGTGLYIKAALYDYKLTEEKETNTYDNLTDEELYNKLFNDSEEDYLRILKTSPKNFVWELIDKIENELYTTKEEVAKDYNVSFIIPKYEEYVYLPNGKIDLTQEEIFTIDNEGDMCLDDAMSIKRNNNGTYTLFIHLANPTATIPYESNTMHEALKRNHTIYLSNNSIPIFDRYLSDNILSILPNKNTNALTIKVGVTPDYSLDLDTLEIIPSIIKNKHKLTYQGAEEIITSTGLLHDDLILISKIFDKQAIDNPRVRAYHHMKERINNQKEVDSEAPIAHMMVEQCNVFANSTIHLIDKREHLGLIMPWRVQREENIELIEKYLEHGSFDINSSGLQLLLKNYMTKSKYSYTNIGHQGLGIDGYVKISSAARRAMDALAVYVLYDLYINRSTDDLDSKYYYWEKEIKYWCEYANNKASDNITFMEQYNYLSSKGKILERRK